MSDEQQCAFQYSSKEPTAKFVCRSGEINYSRLTYVWRLRRGIERRACKRKFDIISATREGFRASLGSEGQTLVVKIEVRISCVTGRRR